MEINRRRFIQTLGLAGGSILLFPACNSPVSRWYFFSEEEASLIIAIVEQLIPADQDPGATDAGVVYFIDKQLVGFYSNFAQNYREGLAALQKYCKSRHGKKFEELDWELQTTVLELMESGKIEVDFGEDASPSFFSLLRNHAMQGFYGSPRHGGNKNYVSYKMLRLDYPAVMGQNRYTPRSSTLNVYSK